MSSLITVEIVHAKKLTPILTLQINPSQSTVHDVKKAIQMQKSYLYPDRQMLRLDAIGKPLKDEDSIYSLKADSKNIKLYFKDLGPQVGWSTVKKNEYKTKLFSNSNFLKFLLNFQTKRYFSPNTRVP